MLGGSFSDLYIRRTDFTLLSLSLCTDPQQYSVNDSETYHKRKPAGEGGGSGRGLMFPALRGSCVECL